MSSKILVTTGDWHAALCCVESLGRKGHSVHVMAPSRWTPAAASRFCAGWIRSPSEYDGKAFLRTVCQELATGGYDLLIPISDRAVEVVNFHRQKIREMASLVLPESDAIAIARDKAETMKLAKQVGVPIPRSLFPERIEDFPDAVHELGLPCVVKMPRSAGSKGVLIAHSARQAIDYVREFGREGNWPFVQAYEPGDTADLASVCDHGRIIASHSFYVEDRHMIGGTPPYARSTRDHRIDRNSEIMAEAIGWHGPLDFDFTRTASGECLLLELNPRFSGTISFAFAVGIDLPQALLDVAQGTVALAYGSPPPEETRYRTGLEYELQWWGMDPVERTRELVTSWLDRGVQSVPRGADPLLFCAQIAAGIRKVRSSRKQKKRIGPI